MSRTVSAAVLRAPSADFAIGEVTLEAPRAGGSPTMSQDGDTVRAAFFQQSSFATHAQATERLVTFYEFSDIKLAFAGAEAGRAIKPILRMS